jgi:hypothetical protein
VFNISAVARSRFSITLSLHGAFDDAARCAEFRSELEQLQGKLREYTRMLGTLAGVEDLPRLEATK